jgi:hypothetical protein
VVVPHVDVVERVAQRGDDGRVAMPEVEHTPVAVTVVEAAVVEGVPEERPGSPSEHEIDAQLLEQLDFAARDVLGVRVHRRVTGVERLLGGTTHVLPRRAGVEGVKSLGSDR